MTPAQKMFVLSMLTDKVLRSPKDYGLAEDGILRVGDNLDFTKLFENTKEIKSILDKAEQTITPGSPKEKSIIENNEKISNWIKTHTNETLDESRVVEILNSKPRVEPMPEPIIIRPKDSTPPVKKIDENQIHEEIVQAKERIAQLESEKIVPKSPSLERTLASDSKNYVSDIKFKQEVETAFKNEIDSIYGKKGLLGMGKMSGINSKEWGEMARLPASKVIEYYTSDSSNPDLAAVAERLSKSKEHGILMKQVVGLMEKSSGAVKPFEGENMEQFIKRLGGYILRTFSQQNAA
jgi:hypothetical protein